MSFAVNVLVISRTPQLPKWLEEHVPALIALNLSAKSSPNATIVDAKKYHAILLDAEVGEDIILSVLADSQLLEPQVPVVVAVNEAQFSQFEYLIRYGAQDFVLKEVDTPSAIRRSIVNAIDRLAVLRATQKAEIQIRMLIENLADGILIIDKSGIIHFCNPTAESLLGRTLSQLYGIKTPFEITGEEQEYLHWERPPDPPVTLAVHAAPILWDGLNAHMLTIRDVTEEQASFEVLKSARKKAESIGSLKSTFLTHMSHELRVPLASIIGFAQIIEEGDTNPDFKEFAGLIGKSSQRLLETINSVLEASRRDQHVLEPKFERIDLAEVISSVVRRLQPLVRQPAVLVSVEGEDGVWVEADLGFLERILTNLLGNAAKFTQQGSIRIRWEVNDKFAVVSVQDTGIGIEVSFVDQAFQPYAQEQKTMAMSPQGTGLGLSITKKLVEGLGGTISVQSVKDVGSTFTFTVPLHLKT